MSHFWSGGEFVLPTIDHPWLRADALIETLKSVDGSPYFLTRHLNRLSHGIKDLAMRPINLDQIREKIVEMVDSDRYPFGRVRITYFSNGDYLISHQELDIPESSQKKPTRLKLSDSVRYSGSTLNFYKSMSYTASSVGQRMAMRDGFDDLLYLNERDEIAETGFSNVLFEIDGKLITPSAASGVLSGIVREVLLEWFPRVEARVVTRSELSRATGLYLLSSIREIELVSELVDGSTTYGFEESVQVQLMRSEYEKRSNLQPDS